MTCVSCPNGKVSWEQFFPYVAPYAQGVPDEIMAHNIRMAAIDLLDRTHILKHVVCVDLQECVEHYCIEMDDCYTVKRVVSVCVNKHPYSNLPVWSHCPPCNTWFYQHPCDMYIEPAPACDQKDGLEVEVVLIPGQDSCFIDRMIYDEYADHIAMGALSRLLLIPNTDWYDPRSAGMYESKYKRLRAQVKLDNEKGHTTGPRRVAPVPGFFI